MLQGYDVSNVNGPNLVIPTNAQFVIAKTTQDAKFVDKLFIEHRTTARSRGIGFGGYHYADLSEQPSAEDSCDFFIDTLGDQWVGEIAALDAELNTGEGGLRTDDPRNRPWVVKWGVRFALKKGYKPKLYISKSGLSDFDLVHPEIAELYELWYAWWPFNPESLTLPTCPDPFETYKLWQYNADNIDKDRYLGTIEEFKASGQKDTSQPVPSTDYEALYWSPITKLINEMVANSQPQVAHADKALHATISNAITLHKISLGVESPS